MLSNVRRDLIRTELHELGAVRTSELASRLGVSRATARRDLSTLVRAGEAVNTHGGILLPAPSPGDAAVPEHEALAEAAARTLEGTRAVGLFGGPVIQALARRLRHRSRPAVVTNSLQTARELGASAHVTVLGGTVYDHLAHGPAAVAGGLATLSLRKMLLDASYFDCDGFDPETGAMVHDLREAELRKVAVAVSTRNLLLVEQAHTQLPALGTFATPTDFDQVLHAQQ
ncbi:MAG TPA: DeoR family transcriptional regulator [Actinocrinis sp.]|nr:DeoR family transcriptional regulator [Actinocrinis sp.]